MKNAVSSEESSFDRGLLAFALQLNRMRLLALQSLRELHRGDLEQAQISSALMTVTVGAGLLRSQEARLRLGKDGLPDPAHGPWPKRAQRISELVATTGLPRETVRRKLHQMESHGEAERDPTGRWLWVMGEASKGREAYRSERRQLIAGVQQLAELEELGMRGSRPKKLAVSGVEAKAGTAGAISRWAQKLGHIDSLARLKSLLASPTRGDRPRDLLDEFQSEIGALGKRLDLEENRLVLGFMEGLLGLRAGRVDQDDAVSAEIDIWGYLKNGPH
jgi:hypothetical protein